MSARDFKYNFLIAVQGAESVTAAQGKLDAFYKSMQTAGTTLKTYGDQATQSFQKLTQGSQQLGQSSQQVATSLDKQKTSMMGVVDTQSRLGQVTQQTNQSLIGGKSAIDQNAQSYNVLKTAQQGSIQSFGQLEAVHTKTLGTWDKLKASSGQLVLGITTLTTGIFNLYNTYDNLNDQEMKLEKQRLRNVSAAKQVREMEEKIKKGLEDGTLAGEQYTQALADLPAAKDKVKLTNEVLKDSEDDLQRAWKEFYINTVPAMIQTLGGGAVALSTVYKAIKDGGPIVKVASQNADDMTGALANMGAAGANAGTGLLAAKGGFAGIAAVAGPVALVIAAVAAALGAIHFNVFGFRDALNAFGKSTGDALPFLVNLLDILKGVAGQLGISGEAADEWGAALKRGTEGFNAQMVADGRHSRDYAQYYRPRS